jgi:hypothetical protein
MKRLQVFAVVAIVALTVVGCRSLTGRSFGQQWDDKTISSQVKTKMMFEKFGSVFSTGVGTHFGVVRLTGNVATPEQKAEAERIASRVAGVKRVENDLLVVPRNGTVASSGGSQPAASPAPRPVTLTGEVTAIDRASGDVTMKTASGDVVVRLPATTIGELEQGQRLSISSGQR